MATPDELERQHTVTTAVARFLELRMRDTLADDDAGSPALAKDESLELLALSQVIARKAGYGRQQVVRSARGAGASWAQIGAALGTTKQAAWEAHTKWIDDQAHRHRVTGIEGLDKAGAHAARNLAGTDDS